VRARARLGWEADLVSGWGINQTESSAKQMLKLGVTWLTWYRLAVSVVDQQN